MTDPAGRRPLTFRPPADVKAAVQDALADEDEQMEALLTAALVAYLNDRPALMKVLRRWWPEKRHAGRPRKDGQPVNPASRKEAPAAAEPRPAFVEPAEPSRSNVTQVSPGRAYPKRP